MKDILFIGPLDLKHIPKAGDVVKNQYLVSFFQEKGLSVRCIDTLNWKRNLFVLLKILFWAFVGLDRNVIYSVSNKSAYILTRLFSFAPRNKKYIYFMIGGYTPVLISQGVYKAEPFKKLTNIVVEADKVCDIFRSVGINNCIRAYNFKPFSYKASIRRCDTSVIRFVFLSRLTKLKGVFLILDAVSKLNEIGFSHKFVVDFYGAIDNEIKSSFLDKISTYDNAFYKGFLNLKVESNYKILSSYDVMLFPTMHETEGFPGVIVDAAIAGLPVIASNWNYAEELVGDNNIGYIIPVGDLTALVNTMKYVIQHREQNQVLSNNAINVASKFHISNVLNDDLLSKLNLSHK